VIVGAAGVLADVAPAATKDTTSACWKTLINDWYDGRIDGIYEIHCYRDALAQLPADLDTYGSARDDIRQALQQRILQGRDGHTTTTAGGGGGNSDNPSGPPGGDNSQSSGPINDALNAGKPGSATSLPVPLLVLGGVALALMAAGGAGFLARRSRLRRMQVASAASVPHGSGPERPEQR